MPILTPEERLGQDVAGRYRLDAVLSTGGMGVLFEATDENTGSPVAVKMLKPAYSLEKDRVARFLRETKIASELRHPNIALVLEVWQDPTGVPFLVMERLRGCSLEEELERRSTLPIAEALAIVLPVAEALALAHACGIVHRDVKPGNIFLCNGAPSVVPKLLDFGIAKTPQDDFETQTGVVLGTPGYMAPEQAQHGECGPFTDVWAIGAVLYRALTGHAPHAGNSVGDTLAKLVREPVPALAAPGVNKSVAATIDRALALDPHRRYADMPALVRALTTATGLTGEATDAQTTTQDFPQVAPVTRNEPRWTRGGASRLAVAALSLALGVFLIARASGHRAAQVAEAPDPAPARETAAPQHSPVSAAVAVDPPANPSVGGPRDNGDEARTQRAPTHGKHPASRAPSGQPPSLAAQAGSTRTYPTAEAQRSPMPDEREPNTGIPVATEW
jgi:eukaryotic-like serine/threonine-protein kinase